MSLNIYGVTQILLNFVKLYTGIWDHTCKQREITSYYWAVKHPIVTNLVSFLGVGYSKNCLIVMSWPRVPICFWIIQSHHIF